MKGFVRLAFISTAATYILIFIGGLVRVSGAGLGCPDWPRCFGRWIPPVSVQQLPADIDPSLFNFTLAWIEYFNRLCGVAVGLLILATAITATIYFRKHARVLYPSIIAALLVAYQGWHGGQVVASALEPIVVSAHMGLALLIVSLMVFLTQQSYFIAYPDAANAGFYPRGSHLLIGFMWLIVIIQIVLGTQVRSAVEALERQHPLLNGLELLARVSFVNTVHTFLGIFTVFLAWMVGSKVLRESRDASNLVKQSMWGMMLLSLVQAIIGLSLILIGLPALMQVFHLWAATLLVGVILLSYSEIRRTV